MQQALESSGSRRGSRTKAKVKETDRKLEKKTWKPGGGIKNYWGVACLFFLMESQRV